jgi:hypothetical protein
MQRFEEVSSSTAKLRKIAMAVALVIGAAQFAGSVPARAGIWDGGGGGAEDHDYNADHGEIYQIQRGDLICHSREACGGAAAIPMNRPGWFYLPRGTYMAADPPPAPVHHRHHRKY